MKRIKVLPVFLLGITAALFLALLTHVPSRAAEIRYPVPCYEGEELAKVRAWEKEWAGKKITPANVDGVKEFLPEVFYNLFTVSYLSQQNITLIKPLAVRWRR